MTSLEFLEDSIFSDDNCRLYSKKDSCEQGRVPENKNLVDCGLRGKSKRPSRDYNSKHFFQTQRHRDTCNEYNDNIELLNSDEKTKSLFSNKLKKSFKSANKRAPSVRQRDVIRSFETQLFIDKLEHKVEENKNDPDEFDGEDSSYGNLHEKRKFCLWNYQKVPSISNKNRENLSDSKIDKLADHENEVQRKCLKQKLRKGRYKKKVERFAKKTGSKTWKGIRTGWKYLCEGLRSLSGPLMTFNVMTDLDTTVKFWKSRSESRV